MQKSVILVAFLTAFLTAIVFLGTLKNGFVNWDDNLYVYDNSNIRSLDLHFLVWALTDVQTANWHPLTWVSHAVDYAIWGMDPLGHHLMNILLHSLNAFLVVMLSVSLLEVAREKSPGTPVLTEGSAVIVGGTAGLLFGVHPLHVESVAWISERKDVLCGFFFLLSLLSYVKYARRVDEGAALKERWLNKNYLLALGFFILAAMSKPMAVGLPVVLLIMDWFPAERLKVQPMRWDILVEKIPFLLIGAAVSFVTILAQSSEGTLMTLERSPLLWRGAVGASALFTYLWKILFPRHLSPFYPYPEYVSFVSVKYLLAVFMIVGITFVSFIVYVQRKQKLWLAVWLFYVVLLLPVVGLIQAGQQAMADRYTYLPSIGPFLLLGMTVAWVFNQETLKIFGASKNLLLGLALCSALVLLVFLTIRQIGVWKDSITLWSYVVREDPSVSFAYNNRGITYDEIGLYDKAMEDYNMAISIQSDFFRPYNGRGVLYLERGLLDEAISSFNEAIRLNPKFEEGYMNRGIAYDRKGLFDKAMLDFDRALAINPTSYQVYINRGVACERNGLPEQAIENYTRAIKINPDAEKAYNNRGVVYYKKGLYREALADLSEAIFLNNSFKEAYYNRALVYFRLGYADRANNDFENYRTR